MYGKKKNPQLTAKEIQSLDRQIAKLEAKVFKAHDEYETLSDQLMELQYKRYPERREEYIKNPPEPFLRFIEDWAEQ